MSRRDTPLLHSTLNLIIIVKKYGRRPDGPTVSLERGPEMNSYNADLHRRLRAERPERPVHVELPRLGVRTIASASLFQRGEHEIGIAHGESLYRLKITRQGKLILNK